MSTTTETTSVPERFSAQLVADALIVAARRSSEHQRLYLSGLLDLSPREIFEALIPHMRADYPVVAGTVQPTTLHAIPLADETAPALLVPYLVGGAQPNGGSAGFAALLRDEIPIGETNRVLLILDDQPVETVRTAAGNAADLDELKWERLANAAAEKANEATRPLIELILEEHLDRLHRSSLTLYVIRDIARKDPAAAGADLHRLGFLSDPVILDASQRSAERLRLAVKWRDKLDSWSAPDKDLADELRKKYRDPDEPGLATVLRARNPFGLDYAKFTLEDLPSLTAAHRKLRLANPLRVKGAVSSARGQRAFVWRPGGGDFVVELASAASEVSQATMQWTDGRPDTVVQIVEGDRGITLTAPGADWTYARLRLPDGSGCDLAIFSGDGDWAPYEARLDVDLMAGGFRTGESPTVLALQRGGTFAPSPPTIDVGTAQEDSQSHRYMARLGADTQPIDLLVQGAIDQQDGPDDYESDLIRYAHSPAHARLEDSRGGSPVEECSITSERTEEGRHILWISAAGLYELASQRLSRNLDGLEVERQIVAKPDITAFTVNSGAKSLVLNRWADLDGLDLAEIPDTQWRSFMNARAALFGILQENHGTVHALCTGTAAKEARAYVDAYDSLTDALLDTGKFLAAYEKIVLCDAVSDSATGEIYIAPTNPVSVAYMLTLSQQVDEWLLDAKDFLDEDIDSFSTRNLMPYFALQGSWYESYGQAPLPWRRYRPLQQANPGDDRPVYISRRIRHFLNVHHEYSNRRQVLALAFYEPGDGTAVLTALRHLVDENNRRNEGELPRLAITIVSVGQTLTSLERMLNATTATTHSAAVVDRTLRERISVKRIDPQQSEPPFAHLAFVFQSTLERTVAPVPLDARSGTLYCRGLSAVPARHTEPDRNETTFHWGTFSGPDTDEGLPKVVRKVLELVGAMPRDFIARGRTRMPSTRISSGFLGDLYESSVWVVHLDRLLGLEAFTPNATGREARYLIDYEDRTDPSQPGLDAITATATVAPYRLALRMALNDIASPSEHGLDRILRLFNGVSGEWALSLVGASVPQVHERIGLATAVASLQDFDGGLGTSEAIGVVIPLGEMLGALPRRAQIQDGDMCDDLLLVRVPLGSAEPTLQCRLIEVKLRSANDTQIAEKARKQLTATHRWLLETFGVGNGPQRLFRSRDLAELIRASALRGAAFGLIDLDGNREQFENSVDAIARGHYELGLAFNAGHDVIYGDFISIERDSMVPVHRQALPGQGLQLGYLRVGRPALQALAEGKLMPRPPGLPAVTFPDDPEPNADKRRVPPKDPGPLTGSTQRPPDHSSGPADSPESGSDEAKSAEISEVAGHLDAAFAKYGLSVEPFLPDLAQPGPSVIRYRTRALGRLSITEVERRRRDLGREIAAQGEIQIGDEPGFVTVDVPRAERVPVTLASVLPYLDTDAGRTGALQFVVGVAPSGQVQVADLSRLPHLLVAGATGSGKSVFLRGLLIALLRSRTPEQLQLLIVDPKRLDFAPLARAPHVVGGTIVSDPDEALIVLRDTLETELARRQPILEAAGVSSATEFYENGGRLEDLPQLVILVDEFADLVLAGSDRKGFSQLIQRYAQLTRAYGIFLVLATQRPSVDVVTGSIKANLSARVAFSLPSNRDSMTVLDRSGAEDLLGNGDLLFYRNGMIERLQAPMATLADVRAAMP